MYSVCVVGHLLERGVVVIHVLEEPLLGELWVGQGLCKGLGMSLHEVVVLELITCEEVGVVTRVHLLFGKVRFLKKCRRDCRRPKENEKKKKLDGMEDSRSKRYAHHVMTMG